MNNGSRRHRILIERLVDPAPTDPFGEPIETWETHARRWAFVEPLDEREIFQAQQTQTRADHKILLPYDSLTKQITTSYRLQHLGKTFDITSARNPDTANAEIRLLALVRT